MDNGYIVRFMRSDDLPDEEYSHCSDADALAQYTSQQPESNDVYFAVQLIEVSGNTRTVKATVLLALSDEEREIASKTARIKIENISPAKFPIFFDLLRRQAVT